MLDLSAANLRLEMEEIMHREDIDGAEIMEKTVQTTIQLKLGLQHADPTPNIRYLGIASVVTV